MSTVEIDQARKPEHLSVVDDNKLQVFSTGAYECRVIVCPDGDRFVARALRLSEVTSEGDTVEQAIERIIEKFRSTLAAYHQSDAVIPWEEPVNIERPKGSVIKWLLVQEDDDSEALRDALNESDEFVSYDAFRTNELGL